MHLKSIELYGFKSFANKMVFKFDKGITAIVGPNGSGKSNVADAVRWVLGEQSAKQLRSSKMQDVIFAGTEARKPLGYCQVDLTIDNHDMKMPIDYSEVTVSRRVYRSGEGEYFINGTGCRMRDVLELFMDTGVGQEGYSIIGQGQIDKILSNKPEERRALFDEAVGIVKYKKRKQRAVKRLENEKQNLYRINDIIVELEGQKDTLMIQAEKAKDYLEIKEVLKTNEVTIFIMGVKKIDEDLIELENKSKIVQNNINIVRSQYQENKITHATYNEKIEQLESEIEGVRTQSTELTLQKEKKESEINLTNEQISHIKSNNERFSLDIEKLKETKEYRSKELEAYKDTIKTLFEDSEDSDILLKKEETRLDEINTLITEEELAVSEIQSNMIERLNEISNVKTKMQRFHTMSENTNSRLESIKARKYILEKAIKELIITGKEEKHLNSQLENDKKDLIIKKEQITATQNEGSSTLLSIEEKRSINRQKLQTLESKYKALSDIQDHYEGYNYSIKKIMALKSEPEYKHKIPGVVADIITVEQQYERAIEIALGGNYQNIITEDEATAKSLIRYLKEHKFGRGTFLPLTTIKPKNQRNSQLMAEPSVIGYANELVDVIPKYQDIVRYLLGRVIIVKHIDFATKLSKKYHNSLRIVTLDGDMVNPGGSLTGGAYKNKNTQFLARKRDLTDMETHIDTLTKSLHSIEITYQKLLHQKEQETKALEGISLKLQELNININSQQMKVHQIGSEVVKAQVEFKELLVEIEQLESQDGDLSSQLSELDQELIENEVNREYAETTVKNIMARTVELKEEKDHYNKVITKIRVRNTALSEQRNHAKLNIDRMTNELFEINRNIKSLVDEVDGNNVEKNEKELLVSTFQKDIVQYTDIIKEVAETILELTVSRHNMTKEQEVLYKNQEELSEKITLLEKDLLRLQNIVAKQALQKETYIEYMWDEYELTYNNAKQYLNEDIGTIGIIEKRIERLKLSIRELGDVNVNAIEDYKNVLERYEFLTTQKEDLVEAEMKLRGVIAELEDYMQVQFKEQFNLINIEFQNVFKELFGGGKAFLKLADEEEVLEAGIYISAQPPGKKLQNMMLLSGGERAFTAIALLFAIQSLKPSPFCILDEIEAALDDVNVDRFAKYLKKLTKNTQFIIITHRRGTMEASDALYGITMQEKGISTQVSVKLIEDVLVT